MNVLFVCSGNSKFGISPFIKSQGDSLVKQGVEVEYFTIKGKGAFGYIKNINILKKYLKQSRFDIVHSHYSLSSYVASLAGAKNQVASLMGSDVNSGLISKLLIKLFNILFWKKCIVKSEDMKNKISIKDAIVIPNGVDMELFKPIDKLQCQIDLGWDTQKKHILFTANPDRYEKNFKLAEKSLTLLEEQDDIELHFLKNINHSKMPVLYNASDVVLLTSLWEGSPNVIKEAMACNCPIVSTDVGDVRWIFGETKGCYITTFDPKDVANKIKLALEFSEKKGKTNGRKRIGELKVETGFVAEKLISLYNDILEKQYN